MHISTHNENCGIGKYQELYIKSMEAVDATVSHSFFPYSPNKIRVMGESELEMVYQQLREAVHEYDLFHIQHEFSFFMPDQLARIVKIIKGAKKPLVSTIHTGPSMERTTRHILSPLGIPARLKNKIRNREHTSNVLPLAQSDVTIVHNQFTMAGLVEIGFNPNTIQVLPIPVPHVPEGIADEFRNDLRDLNTKIHRQEGDIVFSTVGYINIVKGTMRAVKSLSLLPDNYKLTVLGGIHPYAENDDFLDEIADYIISQNLQDRVHITGFIKDDNLLNAYVKNSDIIIYPYFRVYSSSSAALNNGFANHKATIATPVRAFQEINKQKDYLISTDSFSYYDLANKIRSLDKNQIAAQEKLSKEYANDTSYPKLAKRQIDLYRSLVGNR